MRKFIFPLISIFLLLFTSVSVVFAAEAPFTNGSKFVKLGADEEIDKDYFAGGEEVEISGTINGDAYVAGGQVTFDGTVNGDLLIAGGNVTISGEVTQNVRAAGGQVKVKGEIGRNLTVVAGNLEITESAKIAGNLVAGAGNVNIAGPVEGDVTAGTGNLVIANKVGGDVEAGVGTMRLTSDAQVGGDLTYVSDQEARIDGDAKVAGEISQKTPPIPQKPVPKIGKMDLPKIGLVGKIYSFISSLIVALLLVRFYPKYVKGTSQTLRRKPWASLGVGFLTLFFTPLVFLFILITIIGIPLSLLLLAAYLVYVYLAKIYFAFWLGTVVAEKTKQKLQTGWIMVLGLALYHVLTLIRVVGGLTVFFAILFGLGASIITCREVYIAARKKNVV